MYHIHICILRTTLTGERDPTGSWRRRRDTGVMTCEQISNPSTIVHFPPHMGMYISIHTYVHPPHISPSFHRHSLTGFNTHGDTNACSQRRKQKDGRLSAFAYTAGNYIREIHILDLLYIQTHT